MPNIVDITIKATSDQAKTEVRNFRADLTSLGTVTATPGIEVRGSDKAIADAEGLLAELRVLDRELVTPDIRLQGADKAVAESEAVSVAVRKVSSAGKGAEGDLTDLGATLGKLGNLTMPALIGAGVALSPVLLTVGTGMGGLGIAAAGTIGPIMKAAQATGGLQANMSTLSPVQQEMARQLLSLKGQADGFTKSLQPEVVKLWGDGLSIAGTVLRDIQPVAAATGTALHVLLQDLNADLHTGQWTSFFSWMAANAGPDVKLVGDVVISLLNDIPGLVTSLQPLAQGLLIVTKDVFQVIGAMERWKVFLPVLGAAIGLVVGGPMGALVGGLAGAGVEMVGLGQKSQDLADKLKDLPSKQQLVIASTVDWAKVGAAATDRLVAMSASTSSLSAQAAVAAPKLGSLAGDMSILNTATTSADLALKAYDEMWATFVGNSVSDQEAVLNIQQAFESYTSSVKQSGKESTASRQAFLALITTMASGLDTLHKNGASVQQINDYYTTNIAKLNALHGLTPQQRADIQGVTRDYLAWASSVNGLNGNVVKAANGIRDDFLTQLSATHRLLPNVRADTDAFAAAVLKTGNDSQATVSDRARLISDLRSSGFSARDAASFVRGLQAQIDALHGKSVNVGVFATGSGGVQITDSMHKALIFKLSHLATGGKLPGFGGGDRNLALLEDGEAVVDKHRTARFAPVLRAMGVPGMASGGVAGIPPWTAGGITSLLDPQLGREIQAGMNAVIQQWKISAPATSAPGVPLTGPGGGSPGQNVALAQRILGWSGGEFADLVKLWTRESGWNQFAYNASSGATGIPQALPYTKMPRAAWLPSQGGSANVMAQETWGADYIRGRYGSPSNAWAHELAFNWYDNGGWLKPGPNLMMNGTGNWEHLTRDSGPQGLHITLELGPSFKRAGLTDAQLEDIRYTVRTKGGRGPGATDRAFASL